MTRTAPTPPPLLADIRATDPDRTAPPGTDTFRAGAAHPVPKPFRSKERPS
ncbi:hypothetical protein ACIP80_36130 [Streptomyces sp. NPDC088555]|uniref:hypothetical protein n=1 Tax=Streptomyces sp. NPDC088555 TaxID=3365866 RepID=UPI0038081A3C